MFEEKEKDFHIFNEYIRPSEDAIYKLKKFISILKQYQKKMNLIGAPYQVIIGKQTDGDLLEFKEIGKEVKRINLAEIIKIIKEQKAGN